MSQKLKTTKIILLLSGTYRRVSVSSRFEFFLHEIFLARVSTYPNKIDERKPDIVIDKDFNKDTVIDVKLEPRFYSNITYFSDIILDEAYQENIKMLCPAAKVSVEIASLDQFNTFISQFIDKEWK